MRLSTFVALASLVAVGCSSSKSGSSSGSTGATAGTNAGSGATGSAGTNGTSATTGTHGSTNGTGGSNGTTSATNGSGGTNGTSGSCPSITALTLNPGSQNVTLSGGTASPITFTASGTQNGASVSVDASLLTWTATRLDDTDPGTISNGVYQPNPSAGGTVTITATGCGQSATATVTFFLNFTGSYVTDGGASIGSGDFGGADGGVSSANSPKIAYPSDQTRFPRNIYKVLFQWQRQGNDIFRLVFTGANSTVTIYTDGNDPTCSAVAATAGCWQADATTWSAIAGSNAGSTVDLEVDGASASGGTVYASTHETLGFSKRDVPGAIFYWAASVGGIQRATVSDSAPENYLVPMTTMSNNDVVSCAACHALSRDGKFMAVSGQANGMAPMEHGIWNMQVTAYPPPVPLQAEFSAPTGDSYASFSPDDAKLIYSPRNGGQLLVLDADSGALIASAVSDGGAQVKGIAPDWSPDTTGDTFVFQDLLGNITTQSWAGGTQFGQPKVIAPASGMGPMAKKNGFPRYAFEGDWVAYTANNTLLYVVPSDGGAQIELAAANHVVNNGTDANPKETSMPTWAPPGDLRWVAFNSQRAYGLVTTGGTNQLWVAAIDFSLLDGGAIDPSYPAFFLPFQTPNAKNHRAFWVQDIRVTQDAGPPPDAGQPIDAGPPPDAGACVATGDVCNPSSSQCCQQELNGAYCGDPGDGGAVCEVPIFN